MKLPKTFTYKGKTFLIHPDLRNQMEVTPEKILSEPDKDWDCGNILKDDKEGTDMWCGMDTGHCQKCLLYNADDNRMAIQAFFNKYKECFKDEEKSDMVNHPPHYKCHAMESIDEMIVVFGSQAVFDFCRCNAWKYRYRAGNKDSKEEDYKKADWYIAKAKEIQDKEKNNKEEHKPISLKGED